MIGNNIHPAMVLAELVMQVRQGTLQLLDATHSSHLTWSPPGTSNHILWHAGHALWLQDILTLQPLSGRCELPPGWETMFGQGSHPAHITHWPAKSHVRNLLAAQRDRIVGMLSEKAELIATQAEIVSPHTRWPLVPGILHACHDEARHQGEMYLLYKLQKAPT
jgi:hypothetical protein